MAKTFALVALAALFATAAAMTDISGVECEHQPENCPQFIPRLDLTAGLEGTKACKRDRDSDGVQNQIVRVTNAKPLHRVYLYWDANTGSAPIGKGFCANKVNSGLAQVLDAQSMYSRADAYGIATFRVTVTGCYDNYFVALSAPFRKSQCFPTRTYRADEASEDHFYASRGIAAEDRDEVDTNMRYVAASVRSRTLPDDGTRRAAVLALAEKGITGAVALTKQIWNLWSDSTFDKFGIHATELNPTTCASKASALCTVDETKYTGVVNPETADNTCGDDLMTHRCTSEICCEMHPWFASQTYHLKVSDDIRPAPGPGASPQQRASWQADDSVRNDPYDGPYDS